MRALPVFCLLFLWICQSHAFMGKPFEYSSEKKIIITNIDTTKNGDGGGAASDENMSNMNIGDNLNDNKAGSGFEALRVTFKAPNRASNNGGGKGGQGSSYNQKEASTAEEENSDENADESGGHSGETNEDLSYSKINRNSDGRGENSNGDESFENDKIENSHHHHQTKNSESSEETHKKNEKTSLKMDMKTALDQCMAEHDEKERHSCLETEVSNFVIALEILTNPDKADYFLGVLNHFVGNVPLSKLNILLHN